MSPNARQTAVISVCLTLIVIAVIAAVTYRWPGGTSATEPCTSQAEEQYLEMLSIELLEIGDNAGILEDQFLQLPDVVAWDAWQLVADIALDRLGTSAYILWLLDEPPSLQEFRSPVRNLSAELSAGVQFYGEFLDEIDAAKLEPANAHMEEAAYHMENLYAVDIEVCGERRLRDRSLWRDTPS